MIENVENTPIQPHYSLCGSMFGLPIRRHRWFETSAPLRMAPMNCRHSPDDLAFGHKQERAYADAMGCDWMSSLEAREAIPPAYTEHIGGYLMRSIDARVPGVRTVSESSTRERTATSSYFLHGQELVAGQPARGDPDQGGELAGVLRASGSGRLCRTRAR